MAWIRGTAVALWRAEDSDLLMRMSHRDQPPAPWSIETTLLELVSAVQDVSRTDDEVVTVVSRLVNSGRVVLRGIFAGATLRDRGGKLSAGDRRQRE